MEPKVLIVEDNFVFSMILERMILKLNLSCVGVAKTEKEAIQMAFEKKPDLILMDVDLGNGSGISAASSIRKTADIPVIFTTGAKTEKQIRPDLKPHDVYLSKPFLFEDLKQSIHRVLTPS